MFCPASVWQSGRSVGVQDWEKTGTGGPRWFGPKSWVKKYMGTVKAPNSQGLGSTPESITHSLCGLGQLFL